MNDARPRAMATRFLEHCAVTVDRDDPAGLRIFQTLIEAKRRDRLHNQERLRELARAWAGQVHIFCAHDEEEWRRMTGEVAP